MKVANIINIVLQSLAFLGTIIAMLLCYFENASDGYSNRHLVENESIIIAISLFFLGGYQLIHAFVMSILKLVRKEFNWLLGIYWILGLLYVIGLIVVLGLSNFRNFNDNVLFTCVFAAWVPVIYYLIISIVDLVRSLKK